MFRAALCLSFGLTITFSLFAQEAAKPAVANVPAAVAATPVATAPAAAAAVTAPAATPPAATPAATAAQPVAPVQPTVQPGHSVHGDSFSEGPRQKAYLMGNTGKVSFPVTTKIPECQQFINQGVGQLHGFWYFEAERSFRQAAALDSDCGIAYWGMAMANTNNAKRAKDFIAEAVKHKANLTPRETKYIDALHAFHHAQPKKGRENRKGNDQNEPQRDDKSKYEAYTKSLERIYLDHPEDLEAKAFLCYQLWDNRGHGLPITSHLAISSLIKEVLAAEPLHPAHHYMIHLWDPEKAALALDSASRCGQSAAGIAHMWHMSGHIFAGVQRYDDAAWQQEASARVDHAYMQRDHILPDQIHNFAHNNEWLIRDLSYIGRVRDAIDLAKNMSELPRHPKYNTLHTHGSNYYGRTRLFEELNRFELWDELVTLCDTNYLESTDIATEQIKRLRYLGVAKVRKGDLESGKQQIALLEERLKDESRKQAEADDVKAKKESEDKAKADAEKLKSEPPLQRPTAPELPEVLQPAKKPTNDQIQRLEKAIAEIQGHLAVAAGDFKTGLSKLRDAGGVDGIYLARIQFQAGEKDAALKAARDIANSSKNQSQPLAAFVDLLQLAGEAKEAKEAFDKLRAISTHLDIQGSPVFSRLTSFAKQHGLSDDWREVKPPAADVGLRPSLDSLGPFRWQPPLAADWIAQNSAGEKIGLAQFKNKPVILIFFLGHGCLHCSEQLQAFVPKTKEFADQGITLVGISTDAADGLGKSLTAYGDKPFPFTLLSNPALDAFKANRAHDDFEGKPLHATILIDAHGRIRWQDISHEPFKDVTFLLQESKRLLPLAAMPTVVAPAVAAGK
ncbi:MAG: alkyl hydroperoxide reductase/Thiol specific antioxidant/Mal allergen [Planctomycetaceae bacterium]|nr:alkyl hydroperoxide reductase/Thiol specific antioxidant/Mal allergen [Planctomycetaceae bacterium]